jgi:acyl-CoA reductase-like NAD-dependent aldehyde dehydrogenase
MNVTTTITPAETRSDSTIATTFRRQQQFAISLRTSTASERIAKLKKLEAAVNKYKPALYQALAADLRKPQPEADLTEIMPVISEIHHTCKHLKSWMRTKRVRPTMALLGTKASLRYEPKGVTLIISPWNFPINLTLGPLACAIGAGDTAIIKPSEMTPNCSAILAELIRDTFSPEEIAIFEGDATVSTELLSLPFDHIFFTGSPAVGKIVMAAAAKHLASVTLELGGKSPVIVDATADAKKAAASIMWGKFVNNGQTCIAPDYVYVHEKILPTFLDEAKAAITKMYGANAETSPDYCRIVNDKHFARVKKLLDERNRGRGDHRHRRQHRARAEIHGPDPAHQYQPEQPNHAGGNFRSALADHPLHGRDRPDRLYQCQPETARLVRLLERCSEHRKNPLRDHRRRVLRQHHRAAFLTRQPTLRRCQQFRHRLFARHLRLQILLPRTSHPARTNERHGHARTALHREGEDVD